MMMVMEIYENMMMMMVVMEIYDITVMMMLMDDDNSPSHMTIAVEGVGNEVEGGEGGEFVKGSRSDTADFVPKQAQALQVVQALENIWFLKLI